MLGQYLTYLHEIMPTLTQTLYIFHEDSDRELKKLEYHHSLISYNLQKLQKDKSDNNVKKVDTQTPQISSHPASNNVGFPENHHMHVIIIPFLS